MEYSEVIHRCFRCGYCKFTKDYAEVNCPSYRKFRFETYSPGGRMWLLRAWLEGEISASAQLAEIFYACASCGNCKEHCLMNFREDLVDILTAARRELVEQGWAPPAVRDFFKNIHTTGNPYKQRQDKRGEWAEGLGLDRYNGQEYLFYIGCLGSYDDRGKQIARKAASLLVKAGFDIGILGDQEHCDGNEVKVMGEEGLFQLLAKENIARFNEAGVRKIITLSPHSYNVFKKEYPSLDGDFIVMHYIQAVAKALDKGSVSFGELPARVTYQDPCYLGRHNLEYDAPRKVLSAIPGLSLVEMERSYRNSGCCGGGGGNVFTDILGGGPESPARIRVREAAAVGAEILAVACPGCARMLDDALKTEGNLEGRLRVMDISEITEAAGIKR
jgi:Fe-S oxidoreductase